MKPFKEERKEEIRKTIYDIAKEVERYGTTTNLGGGCPKCGSHNYEVIGSGGRFSKFGYHPEKACRCKDCGWYYVIVGC